MHFLLPFLAADTAPAPSALSSGIDAVTKVLGPFGVEPTLLLGQAVNFCVVAAIVYYFAIKPVLATVDERNKKIAEGLQFAEDSKKKLAQAEVQQADILKQASLEGKKVIGEARDTGKALVDKAAQDATRTAEEIVKKGNEAVALERSQMLNDLRREVAQLVVTTANRVLARDLTAEERARFNTAAAQDLSKN
jgi:F-type H+-transporting ATPase subunit b